MEDPRSPLVDSPDDPPSHARSALRIQAAWRKSFARRAGSRYTHDLLSKVSLDGFTWRQRAKVITKLANARVANVRKDLARLQAISAPRHEVAEAERQIQLCFGGEHCSLGALLIQSAWRGHRTRLALNRPKLSRTLTRPARQESAFAAPHADQDPDDGGSRPNLWVGREFLSSAAQRLVPKSEGSSGSVAPAQRVITDHGMSQKAAGSSRDSLKGGRLGSKSGNQTHVRNSFDRRAHGRHDQGVLRDGSEGSSSPSREPRWQSKGKPSRTSSSSIFSSIWASPAPNPPEQHGEGEDTDVSPEAVEAASALWTGEHLTSYLPANLSESLSTTTNWVTGFFSEETPCFYKGTRVRRIAVPGTRKLCNPRQIVIYFSDTGGGHYASASALKAAFEKQYGSKLQIEMIDFVRTAMYGIWKLLPEAYSVVGGWPTAWKMLFELSHGEKDFRQTNTFAAMLKMNRECALKHLADMVEKGVDLIISVHPLINHLIMHCLEEIFGEQPIGVKVITVVTDLGSAHLSWFEPRVDAIFVPSDMIRLLALEHEFQKEKIYQCGLPVREGFWHPTTRSRAELQAELLGLPLLGSNGKKRRSMFSGGWSPVAYPASPKPPSSPSSLKFQAHRVVLLMGGGEGFGSLVPLAKSLGEHLGKKQLAQLVVVCGRNEDVYKCLENHEWPDSRGLYGKPIILSFVSEMDLYMATADVVVTKAGPGTIAEAMIQGLPCLLTSFIPGQEEGNVTFVQESGAGTFVSQDEPDKVVETVETWLADPLVLERMSEKAREASRPHATLEIARHIGHNFLELQKPVPVPVPKNEPFSGSHAPAAPSDKDAPEVAPARRRTVHINNDPQSHHDTGSASNHPESSDLAEFSDFARVPERTATDLADANQKWSLSSLVTDLLWHSICVGALLFTLG